MNITNVVLDRDKKIVTFDTAEDSDIVMPVIWTEGYGWILGRFCEYEGDVNKYLIGMHHNGTSPIRVAPQHEEPKPDQVTTFTIPEYYNNQYKGLKIDPYRIFKIYHIKHPCQQHAIKKLLRGTNKGDIKDDLELIESLEGILARWKEMIQEDAE